MWFWAQVGVLAAAGLVALDDFEAGVLLADHARARRLAEAVSRMRGFHVDLTTVQTNIVIVHCDPACAARDARFKPDAVVARLAAQGVQLLAISSSALRVVTHRDITDDCVDALVLELQTLSDCLED